MSSALNIHMRLYGHSKARRERWRFFMEHGGYCTPPGRAACALAMARAEEEGEKRGLVFWFEDEEDSWESVHGEGEGACPAPAIALICAVFAAEDCDEDEGVIGDMRPKKQAIPLASVGMVGLDRLSDPYLRVVRAELLLEALAYLKAKEDVEATLLAVELSSRATYAGPSPEVCSGA